MNSQLIADHPQYQVGIAAIGSYIPPTVLTCEEMAKRSNLPLSVFAEKIGMKQKHIAIDEHPSEMGFKAAKRAIAKANISPDAIDLIAYCSAGYSDYRFWSPAAKIQAELGAQNAFAFEINNFCNSGNLGLHICRNYLLADPNLSHALVICSDSLFRLIDPDESEVASLLIFADGAVAAVLKKGEASNRILNYSAITDGQFVDELKIPLGGTRFPAAEVTKEERSPYIQVSDAKKLDTILSKVYLKNYKRAIVRSLQLGNHEVNDLDFLFTNQVKLSLLKKILGTFDIAPENSFISLVEYGHMGAVDTLFCLQKTWESGKINSGNLVVMASSASGFSWGALTLQFL